MGSECTICVHFSKIFPGETLDGLLQEGDDLLSRIYTAKGKNFPASRISEIGALKTKITQNFEGKNQQAIGKQLTQNAPFASIFLKKKFPGEAPGPPPAGGGYPLPHPLPVAIRADFVTPPGSGPSGSATVFTQFVPCDKMRENVRRFQVYRDLHVTSLLFWYQLKH